jgi:hypothetical protein
VSVALKAAEAALEQCKAMSAGHKRPARRASMEPLQKRVDRMRQRLSQGGEVARSVLREVFPESIWLQVARSGRHFYAVFEDGVRATLFDDSVNLAEFPIEESDAGLRKAGEIGSGGTLRAVTETRAQSCAFVDVVIRQRRPDKGSKAWQVVAGALRPQA